MNKRYRDFVLSVNAFSRSLQKIRTEQAKSNDLKGAETTLLLCLSFHSEGLTNTELVENCNMDKAAVSRSLTELREKNYIRFEYRDGKSRYGAHALLTEAGKEITAQIEERLVKVLNKTINSFSTEEKKAFFANMMTVANTMVELL